MMKTVFWSIIAISIFVAGGLAGRAFFSRDGAHDAPRAAQSTEPTTSLENEHESGVTIDDESAQRIDLKVQPLAPASVPRQAIAYGLVENDPASTFTLRAPVAGTLRTAPGKPWPSLGSTLADGAAIGDIEPRVTAMERADLASRLAAAASDADQARAALDAAQHSYDSKRDLNEQGHIVSDRVIEEALSHLKAEQARLKAAEETMQLIHSALTATSGPAGPLDLVIARGGEVVDVFAQPDESVEAGQPIVRLSRFDRLLARLTAPPGQLGSDPPHTARLTAAVMPDHPIDATMLAVVPVIDSRMQGVGLVVSINAPPSWLRPGMSVRAFIDLPGTPRTGVVLPRSAIVRHAGTSWVFIETAKNKFVRTGVSLDQPVTDGWFSLHGAKPGDSVVIVGAESLLGQEMKPHFEAAEAEE